MKFSVEITTFNPAPTTVKRTFEHPAEAAIEVTSGASANDCAVLVATTEAGVNHGEFILWLSNDRAVVRVDEHREHMGLDRGVKEDIRPLFFKDDDGSAFQVPYDRTVSRVAALNALIFWLPSQARTNRLEWE